MKCRYKLFLLCSIIFLAVNSIKAQDENAVINLTLNQQRLDTILNHLGEQSGFEFSYNPGLIPVDTVISVDFRNIRLKEVLESLNEYAIVFIFMDEHIILKKSFYTYGTFFSFQRIPCIGNYINKYFLNCSFI